MIRLFLLLIIFICGCFSTQTNTENIPEQYYDCSNLKTTEKTYRVCDSEKIAVYVDSKKENVKFNNEWFVVHNDLLKTMNENQDFIIQELKKDSDKNFKVLVITFCVISAILLLLLFIYTVKRT